jgi:hypothetical protein
VRSEQLCSEEGVHFVIVVINEEQEALCGVDISEKGRYDFGAGQD